MMERSNAIFYTVECAYPDKQFQVTKPDNPRHIQLRSDCPIWIKENLMNIGMRSLPADAKYVAFVDADLLWLRPDWAEETIRQLHEHAVVQMFSHGIMLDANHCQIKCAPSFAQHYRTVGYAELSKHSPGRAWAWRIDALKEIGGLYEHAIIGSGDTYMAFGCLGQVCTSAEEHSMDFAHHIFDWQSRAFDVVKGKIGVVSGALCHYWHGDTKDRQYRERRKILRHWHYNPDTDIAKNENGVIRLANGSERLAALRQDIYRYFLSRNEDCTSLELKK
jgi:hypothetical protein